MRWALGAMMVTALFAGCTDGPSGPEVRPNVLPAGFWFTAKVQEWSDGGKEPGEERLVRVLGTAPAAAGLVTVMVDERRGLDPGRPALPPILQAWWAENRTMVPVTAWRGPCGDADLCLEGLGFRLGQPREDFTAPRLQFPLQDGGGWSAEGGRDLRLLQEAETEGPIPVEAGGRTVQAYRTEFDFTLDAGSVDAAAAAAGYQDASIDLDQTATMDYAPDPGLVVGVRIETQVAVSYLDGGQRVEMERDDVVEHRVTGWGQGTLAEATALLGLVRLPDREEPKEGFDLDAQVVLRVPPAGHVGKATLFTADVQGSGAANMRVAWTVWREGFEQRPVVATGEGPLLGFTPPSIGHYRVEARAVDPHGRTVDSVVEDWTADGAFAGTAACEPAAAPLDLSDPAVCGGLRFDLLPGAYVVRAAATVPQGQGALPCPYLALYEGAEELARNYAWPELEPTLDTSHLALANTTLEVRWVPSAAAGGSVDYTATIIALGPGGYGAPGGRGC